MKWAKRIVWTCMMLFSVLVFSLSFFGLFFTDTETMLKLLVNVTVYGIVLAVGWEKRQRWLV